MAVTVAVVGKDAAHFVFDDVRTGAQDGGVKVALERDVFAEDAPRTGERGRPVKADGSRAAVFHHVQPVAAAFGKEDDRRFVADAGDDALHVGERVFAVGLPGEAAAPAVKEHHRLRARFDLCQQVGSDGAREFVEQEVQGARLLVEQGFGAGKIAARLPFNHVGGKRPRAASEADERHAAVQFAPDEAHRLHDVAEVVVHVGDGQCLYVGVAAHRAVKRRALAGDEGKPQSHRIRDGEDVGEEDGGVEAEARQRLQGHFAGEFRRLAEGHKLPRHFAGGAVFRQIAPGLAHHPDGGSRDGFAAQYAQQEVVFHEISL